MNPDNSNMNNVDREEQILRNFLTTYRQEIAFDVITEDTLIDLLMHEQINGTFIPDHPITIYYQSLKEKIEQTPNLLVRYQDIAEKFRQMPMGESPKAQFEQLSKIAHNIPFSKPIIKLLPRMSMFRYAVAASFLIGFSYFGLRSHSHAVTPYTIELAEAIGNTNPAYQMRDDGSIQVQARTIYRNMSKIEQTRKTFLGFYPHYDQAVVQQAIQVMEAIRVDQQKLRLHVNLMTPIETEVTFYLAKAYLIQGNASQAESMLQLLVNEGDGPLLSRAQRLLIALKKG